MSFSEIVFDVVSVADSLEELLVVLFVDLFVLLFDVSESEFALVLEDESIVVSFSDSVPVRDSLSVLVLESFVVSILFEALARDETTVSVVERFPTFVAVDVPEDTEFVLFAPEPLPIEPPNLF